MRTLNIQKKLEDIGLEWVKFQVLRRKEASLGYKKGVDPEVAADQRGHGTGVAIDTHIESDLVPRAILKADGSPSSSLL
jgi:hypothetical protein